MTQTQTSFPGLPRSATLSQVIDWLNRIRQQTPVALVGEQSSLSGAGVVTFTSIPFVYRDLRLVVRGAGSAAATFVAANLTLNNDSGANYDYQTIQKNNTADGSAAAVAQTSFFAGWLPAASGVSSASSAIVIDILNYCDTNFHKTVMTRSGMRTGLTVAGLFAVDVWGDYRSTLAISRVDVALSSGNFASGSVASLYGLL